MANPAKARPEKVRATTYFYKEHLGAVRRLAQDTGFSMYQMLATIIDSYLVAAGVRKTPLVAPMPPGSLRTYLDKNRAS